MAKNEIEFKVNGVEGLARKILKAQIAAQIFPALYSRFETGKSFMTSASDVVTYSVESAEEILRECKIDG